MRTSREGTGPSGKNWREPRRLDELYLSRVGLAKSLRKAISQELGDRHGLTVVDLGCGTRPYEPWFEGIAGTYLGVDQREGPGVDHIAPAEDLDFLDDASVDVVLCTQVLEHVTHPQVVVDEMARILRPGGVVFCSTHGVFPYHSDPFDYWRWTHLGLQQVFQRTRAFGEISVTPTEGIATTIAALVDFYATLLGSRYWALGFLRYTLHPALSFVPHRLDRYLDWMCEGHPLAVNYLVVAKK